VVQRLLHHHPPPTCRDDADGDREEEGHGVKFLPRRISHSWKTPAISSQHNEEPGGLCHEIL